MDKRIEKTKKALRGAFMELRRKNELRDIKITQLCNLADINKTTFYSHYRDIYELSEDVEKQLILDILLSIPHNKNYTFDNPSVFTKEVTLAFRHHVDELKIVFSDSEYSHLSVYMEQILKQIIFDKYPQLRNNAKANIVLSYCIQGAFGAQMNNLDLPTEQIVDIIQEITSVMQPVMNFE